MDSKEDNKKLLIYEELIKLSDSLTNYFAGELQDYLGLITFFEQIKSQIKEIVHKISLPKNYKFDNPDYLNLRPLYSFHSSFLDELNEIEGKINNDVLCTLKDFKEEFESDNKNIYFSLNSIIEDISIQKNKLNQIEKELEKEKSKNNKEYKKSEKYNLYEKEMDTMNKLYSKSEEKFVELKKIFKENELKKNKIISMTLYIYLKIIHEDLDSIDNKNGEIKNLIKKYKLNQENQDMFNDIFSNFKILNTKKWDEKSMEWEEIKFEGNEVESIIINKSTIQEEKKEIKKEENNVFNTVLSEFYIPQITINNNIIGIDDEYMLLKGQDKQNDFVDIVDDEQIIKDNITINNFLYGLDNINQKNDILLNIEDIFGRNIGDKDFYIDFCDKIIKAKGNKNTLYEFKVFSNLIYLTNVLNLILENIKDDLLSDKISKEYFSSYKILDQIICIGEKSVNENTYMCALLSKNKIFKNQKIWINCIKNKIINLLNDLCKKEYFSKSKDTVFRPADFINKNVGKLKMKIIGKIGGLLGDREKNLIELCNFNEQIEYYSKLSKEQKKMVDNNALSIYHGVIKCYIRHITNYNFNLDNATDIISLICSNLHIKDDDHIIFYCYYYQDCVFTTKKINYKNKSFISKKNKEKIEYIKSDKEDGKKSQKFVIDIKKDGAKYFIIKKVSKYLPDEDKLKLIGLGKYYMKIKNFIYKSLLKKDISVKKRVNIWKAYLKYNNTITLYNYKQILEETQTDFFKKENEASIIQIEKDKNRTYLRKKNEDSPQIIYNILISFVYSENKINYVQGINSILGFLYDLTENEEETFHLLISIFIMTQIRDIYDDDQFQKLKQLFYTIERLVYLFLPKIYSKLKDNNIELNFFMSAYFITLYTILYPNLPENDISFMLHLWDDFIFDGWSSFFSNWLAILKYHENDIIELKEDKLINFLTNSIKESDLYKKENYLKFLEIRKKFKVSEELIKNLQDEIALEVGIRKIGASTIIEDFNADDKAIK